MTGVPPDQEVREIANRRESWTDGSKGEAFNMAFWCRDALAATESTGGLAVVEIGVRRGGMSAIFCDLVERTPVPGRIVLSVDPWGDAPYFDGVSRPQPGPLRYGEDLYAEARRLLAESPRSAVFRMPSEDFIAHVLPTYRWWFDGRGFPTSRRFVAFAWVDGQHENTHLVQDVAGLVPFVAPGGTIALDNVRGLPEGVALLAASPRLGLVRGLHWASRVSDRECDLFTVP